MSEPLRQDGLCEPAITIRAHQLPATVCVHGGADCPLISREEALSVLQRVSEDPTAAIRLTSSAECIEHHTYLASHGCPRAPAEDAFNRKRDLDILQRLGILPGDVRRARYLYTRLFELIPTLNGVCAHDTRCWEGCPIARTGVYEAVREKGWQELVGTRTDDELARYRDDSARRIESGDSIPIRSHHLMCLSCWYAGGQGRGPRPNDTLHEVLVRVRQDPEVKLTLIEGCCEACECCEGYDPATGRCVHAGGLIRDFKKDLDVFQKMGLMPGATLTAREAFDLLFERVQSTSDICGYGDDVVRSHEWEICSGPGGNSGYEKTRQTGVFGPWPAHDEPA